jgi:signal transduction histidine kinase
VDPRWRTVLAVAPYLVLVTLVAFTTGIEWGDRARLVPELLLCAAYAAWMLVLRTLRLPWTDRPAAIAVFLAGAILLNLVLVLHDGWFGFLVIATFTFAYSLADWPWELPAVGATAVVAGIAQSSSIPRGTALGVAATVVVIVLNVVVMCGMSWGQQLATRMTERSGVEGERARLAREIHDTLAQGYVGVSVQLEVLAELLRYNNVEAATNHLDNTRANVREGLAEARQSIWALRSQDSAEKTLPIKLRRATEHANSHGLEAAFSLYGAYRPMPPGMEREFLRVGQEAIHNVKKHADAKHLKVQLEYGPAEVALVVRDDGRGFLAEDGLESPPGHYGLTGMRERAEAIGGTLEVTSEPGFGTTVRLQVMTPKEARAKDSREGSGE